MRRIGTLSSESLARRFCDYLTTLSIDAAADRDGDEDDASWDIWIRDEKDVDQAREEFTAFQAAPEDARYRVKEAADQIRDDRVAEQQRRLKIQRETQRSMPANTGAGGSGVGPIIGAPVKQTNIPITIGIIIVSVIVSFSSNFSKPRGSRDGRVTLEQKIDFALSFVDFRDYVKDEDSFASIRKGEIWRFVTPMFLHGDPFHLAFNMLWIFFLGSAIERLHGSLFIALLVIGTQVAGMMLQVSLPTEGMPETLQGTPFAIGASGAVYGLFGYLWVRPAIDPGYPIHMVPSNVVLMLGWLVFCMLPILPMNVANGAHLGGLFGGIAAALVARVIKQ